MVIPPSRCMTADIFWESPTESSAWQQDIHLLTCYNFVADRGSGLPATPTLQLVLYASLMLVQQFRACGFEQALVNFSSHCGTWCTCCSVSDWQQALIPF